MDKINPQVDIAFKKIFGVTENKDLLISLINSIVSDEDQVSDITLLNPYNPTNFRDDEISILDIKAQDKDGKRFNIEIQINSEDNDDKRVLYHWAKLYTEQMQRAGRYDSLSKTIRIHILTSTSTPGATKYHKVFHISEKETRQPYFTDLELHTIELKKFLSDKDEFGDITTKIKNDLDIWIAFLTHHDLLNKDSLPLKLDSLAIKKALHVLEEMSFEPQERDIYEEHLKITEEALL